jgi:hypothetical protein
MGCAGENIAKLVADSLNLELFDDARLQHTVQTMGKEFEGLKHFDEKAPGFFRFAFQREWNDLSLYDLAISTEKMMVPSAADVIVAAAQSQEMKTCSLTALDAMDRLSLEKRIEAALLKNSFNPLYKINLQQIDTRPLKFPTPQPRLGRFRWVSDPYGNIRPYGDFRLPTRKRSVRHPKRASNPALHSAFPPDPRPDGLLTSRDMNIFN